MSRQSIQLTRKSLFDATIEGYCLVFKRKTKYYQLFVDRNDGKRHKLILKQAKNCKTRVLFDGMDPNDMLLGLQIDKYGKQKRYPIEYRIIESLEENNNFENIYVVISCDEKIIETWAEERDIDVPIDPRHTIICAKQKCKDFLLADRTYLKPEKPNFNDEWKYKLGKDDDEYKRDLEAYKFECQEEEKLKNNNNNECIKIDELININNWDNIHIGYESVLHNKNINLYRKPFNTRRLHPVPSVISHCLYLRILYEILTDDIELDGANFVIEQMLTNKYHPLCQFFALHQIEGLNKIEKEFKKFKCVAMRWNSKGNNTNFLDEVRRYYGEEIAFYFAFLVHYTVWLYPLAIIGTIWWIIEYSILEISSIGGILVILIIIMWTTLLIENWYKREWKLRFKWGMMRYKHTEIPRPTFHGKYIISSVNGMRIETYNNKYLYWFKRIISIFISFICVLLVICITAFLWGLKDDYNDKQGIEGYIGITIGMLVSAQILLFNRIYTRLAIFLNEWEGHRLQQEYYNQLVIKRISFIVINSFYSLFYIAFVDSRKSFNDNKVRLKALRLQLVILFLMAIIYQNILEIFFPVCCPKFVLCCNNCCSLNKKNKRKKKSKQERENEIKSLIINDNQDGDDDDMKYDNDKIMKQPLNKWNINDIVKQSEMSISPDVLDNTAEIIVLHGYVSLFIVVFPLMPLLGVINNFVELFVDKYNLRKTQRPIPRAAGGLGVWGTVLSVFSIVAIYTNLAILTFKTDIVINLLIKCEEFFKNIDAIYWTNEDMKENQITFYMISTTFFVFVVVGVRMCIPEISNNTADDIARQEICQRELIHISRTINIDQKK